MNNSTLTKEEEEDEEHKDAIISFTEEVIQTEVLNAIPEYLRYQKNN